MFAWRPDGIVVQESLDAIAQKPLEGEFLLALLARGTGGL
jgi:hypothetical protein